MENWNLGDLAQCICDPDDWFTKVIEPGSTVELIVRGQVKIVSDIHYFKALNRRLTGLCFVGCNQVNVWDSTGFKKVQGIEEPRRSEEVVKKGAPVSGDA